MTAWRAYAVVAAAAFVAGLGAYSYAKGYSHGKQAVLAKLQADRITVFKDGQRIDNEVLSADDSDLVCLLVPCGVQPDAQ